MGKLNFALTVALCLAAPLHAGDFDNGFFIMNEEGSGVPNNGSINYFEPGATALDAPTWKYRADRTANPEHEIPGAITHAIISSGKMYIVSNHPIEAGSYSMTGAMTILDAETLEWVATYELVNAKGEQVQGRAVCAGLDGKILITTTNGILKFDPEGNEFVTSMAGTMGTDTDPQPYQNPLQTGMMVNVDDVLYIASQKRGLVIIDEKNDIMYMRSLTELFDLTLPEGMTEAMGIGSITKDNDGNLWMSITADQDATGAAASWLVKYNPANEEAEAIVVPNVVDGTEIYPPANSWYAWTADGFHFSTKNNALYWNGGSSTWFSNQRIYKYDLSSREFSRLMTIAHSDMEYAPDCAEDYIYGCSMRSCPETGDMYISLFKDYASTEYELMRLDSNGNLASRYTMQPDMWFPSYILFPKGEDAGVRAVGADRVAAGGSIQLGGKALNLSNSTASALPLQIYTPAGRLVAVRSVAPGDSCISTASLSLPSGIYLVRLGSAAISVRL